MRVCEFGQFKADVKRCRNRARHYVGYRYIFAHQVGPKGDVPVYNTAATWRCEAHKTTNLPGEFVASLHELEYAVRMAELQAVAQPS